MDRLYELMGKLNPDYNLIIESVWKDKLKSFQNKYSGDKDVKGYLKIYRVIKDHLPSTENDIMKIKEPEKLFDIVEKFFNDKKNNDFFVKNENIYDLYLNIGIAKDKKQDLQYNIYSPIDSDVVYEDENIVIISGGNKAKCIRYGNGESWCISQKSVNYFNNYRVNKGATIYFVLQKDKDKNNKEEKLVILNYPNQGYGIADKTNSGDRSGSTPFSWKKIEDEIPNLNGLEEYFKQIPVTEKEKEFNNLPKVEGSLIEYYNKNWKGFQIGGDFISFGDFVSQYLIKNNDNLNNYLPLTDEHFIEISEKSKEGIERIIESGFSLNPKQFYHLKSIYRRRYLTVGDNKEKIIKILTDKDKKHEKYIEKILNSGVLDLSKLSGIDITDILIKSPIAEKIFDSGELDLSKLNNYSIINILIKSPIAEKIFDSGVLDLSKLSELSGNDIINILIKSPIAEKIFNSGVLDLSKLSGIDIKSILINSPIAEKILNSGVLDLSKLSGNDISNILIKSPIAEKILNSGVLDLSKLNDIGIKDIITKKPEFSKYLQPYLAKNETYNKKDKIKKIIRDKIYK